MMLKIYTGLTALAEPFLNSLLNKRLNKGKEDAQRVDERRGIIRLPRPSGRLLWLHAASVGEAQSALILIHAVLKENPDFNIMVTSGTVTSAQRMKDSLPERVFHQYVPLDHPQWVSRFLDHWKPNCVFWMESELWPNMLLEIKRRNIPAALINARLSPRSFSRWKIIGRSILKLLAVFDVILAQTDKDADYFKALGADNVQVSGNLKYSAAPLSYHEADLAGLSEAVGKRPLLIYASTHKGEENIAADLHVRLRKNHQNLLTIIIPRHPERGDHIAQSLSDVDANLQMRGTEKSLPDISTGIYIADTLGELGLFYRLGDIVYIGRSLSHDGGGGHNPLEPAQLKCAILHGEHIQNLREIYDDMQARDASICVKDADMLFDAMQRILTDDNHKNSYIETAYDFAHSKAHIVEDVMKHVRSPLSQERGGNG
ncbi:MAG: 3-deoxy-D-manno-octulosonic acid transferase [Bdellovibrionales bacterium]